jgi:cell division transport system permease protein
MKFLHSKITAAVSIALVLFLLGLTVFIALFAGNLSNSIRESMSFDIVLHDYASKEQIKKLQNTLKVSAYAKSTEYISKDEALKQLTQDLGQNPKDFLGYNPLPNMITVHLRADYANPDSLAVIKADLKDYANSIKTTEYREDTLKTINRNLTKIGYLLLAAAAVLLFISFALIGNTIRLMVHSQRFLIHTMQLVGAKRSFIRGPYIGSNLLLGLVSAVVACGLLYWLIYSLSRQILTLGTLYDTQMLLIVFGSVLLMGILISVIATWFAVNKYIKADVEDLYKM